jgi:spore maturation protein CgeB
MECVDQLAQIDQACEENDHELIKSLLTSVGSSYLKRQAYEKVIKYFEKQSLFPVGYMMWFIQWLICTHNYPSAMEQIEKCKMHGVDDDRLSEIVYENLIKPEEAFYRDRFNKNLSLMRDNKILFSDYEFNFEEVKKKICIIANSQPRISEDTLVQFENKRIFVVDIMNVNVIGNILDKALCVYLVYSSIQMFYYLLLFEDFHEVNDSMNKRRLIVFPDGNRQFMKDFFVNLLHEPPRYCFGLSINEKYSEFIDEINRIRKETADSIAEELNVLYGGHDERYYKELFKKKPKEIKILLVSSEVTELNKFITRNWHEAFLALGYQSAFLIESNPFECMNNYYVYEQIKNMKPDIVFHINLTVNEMLSMKEGAARENVLWIMRYRDTVGAEMHHAGSGYQYNNMFVLPIFTEWEENLRKIGIPEKRIRTIPDGVNINLFSKSDMENSSHTCDIVSVNNAVGNIQFRLNYYLREVTNDNFKAAVYEVVEMLQNSFNDEKLISRIPDYNAILRMLNVTLKKYGMTLRENCNTSLINLFEQIMNSLCREKIMEWIVDSGITQNIRCWGTGWSNIATFKKYYAGVARHGKELASIYGGSRIAISDSHWALHERNFEIMASGGFPLVRYVYISETEKVNEITNYFEENKEVVLFYSRDDLLNKIQHYLDNPEEREMIAERGRRAVLEQFSHIATAEKAMNLIKDFYRD